MLFSACNTAATEAETVDIEKIKPIIQAMEDVFAAGEKAKDINAVAVYYSDDATSYIRGNMPQVGVTAIKEGIAKNIAEDSSGNHNVYKVVDFLLKEICWCKSAHGTEWMLPKIRSTMDITCHFSKNEMENMFVFGI